MNLKPTSGFTLPFLFGTALGMVGGAVIGMFVAQYVFRLFSALVARAQSDDADDRLRLDLLLQ
jgi:uncharacterized membrane protein YccC